MEILQDKETGEMYIENNMKIVYDKEADAIYIYFVERSAAQSARTYGDWPFFVDVNDKGEAVGIEILDVSIVLNKGYLARNSVPIGMTLIEDDKTLASRLLDEVLKRGGLTGQHAKSDKEIKELKQILDSSHGHVLTQDEQQLFDAVLDQIINSKELADLPEDEVLELSERIKRWPK